MSQKKVFNTNTEHIYVNNSPEYNLDLVNVRGIDPTYSFTRNSAATYVGPDGLIKTAGVNQPRFDYDPMTGECKGLLVEELRTNSARPSEPTSAFESNTFLNIEFGYGQWARFDSTVTSQNRLGINGLNVIPRSTIDTNGYNGGYSTNWAGLAGGFNADVNSGPGSSFSFYINPNTWTGPIYSGLLPTGNTTFIPRSSNTLIFNNGIYAGDSTWNVEEIFEDGTYRLSKRIVNELGGYGTWIAQTGSAFCVFTTSVGNGNNSWWIGGLQYEAGKSVVSSYIPTTSSAVTRQPDQLILNKNLNTKGTFFIESNPTQGVSLAADNGSSSLSITQQTDQYTKSVLYYNTNRTLTMSSDNTTPVETNTNPPQNLNRVSLGFDGFNNTNYINGHIKKFSYYSNLLTEDNLRALTGNKNTINRAN